MQLGLPIATARFDRLCATLPITPGEVRPDGSIVSLWTRGPAALYGDRFPAWEVRPVPEGCLAWESGARWFFGAQTRTITAVGSSHSSGPRKGTRDEVAEYAQELLVQMDARWRQMDARWRREVRW